MGSVSQVIVNGKLILVVDYAGCNEAEMIKLSNHLTVNLNELPKGTPWLVLSCHENSFITGAFLRAAEKHTRENIHHLKKMAFTGIDPVKRIILKGYSFMFRRNFKSFNTREEALAYLASDETSDQDNEVNSRIG